MSSDPVLFTHPSSLEHETGAHPERAARLVAIDDALTARGHLGWALRSSPLADDALLTAVHPASHVEAIRGLSERGGGWIDAETACSPGSFRAAAHSSGGAAAMVDALLGEGARAGASLHRPPGHHAEIDRAMGFCLFNTVAVAARRARDAHGVSRVLVLDWDVHHGNGTEDVFRSTDEVLYVSIHEAPLYPGSGPVTEVGSGAGEGYTVNLPVPSYSGDDVFTSLVADVVVPLIRSYAPGLVLISAGYDAHAGDPLANCTVTDDGFRAMAASMRAVADEIGVPVGLVLEGGYDTAALARSVIASLEELGRPEARPPARGPVHALSTQALERLAGHWPGLRPPTD